MSWFCCRISCDRIGRVFGGERHGDPLQLGRADDRGAPRHHLGEPHGGSAAGRRLDRELVHQPPGAVQPDPHAGGRSPRAVEDRREIADAGAAIGDDDLEALHRGLARNPEFDPAAAPVFERVARDLGYSRGNAGLVLSLEADQLGQPPGALAHQHDVGFRLEREDQETRVHEARIARTVASSRPRRWSRNSTPAISEGWLAASPG